MKQRHAQQTRQGLNLAEMTILNPLFAEHARALLTPLGYRVFLRLRKSYGHVSPGGYVPI